MKARGHILFLLTLLLVLSGCNLNSGIKIDRNSVQVIQGKYTGDMVYLTFSANLTSSVSPGRSYWSRYDGRFHWDPDAGDGITLIYEVLTPFGEVDVSTMSTKVGPTHTVSLPLPVFWTEENPFEYTLRISFYIDAQKQDTYYAQFRLRAPETK